MKFTLTDFNIVITANAHNPSILNPDFLRINNIVDAKFNPVESLCTPPISQIRYDDNISVAVDSERLTFSDNKEERLLSGSPIPAIAINYIDVLKHVPYKAVGINFIGFYEFTHMAPDQFLLNKFIKQGSWCEFEGVQPGVGLNFSYVAKDIVHNLSINPANITRKKEGRSFTGIAIRSNFHYTPQKDMLGEIAKVISEYEVLYNKLREFLQKVFE